MTTAILALGSNLGDRLGNLRAAIALLAERDIRTTEKSSVWETAPVPADQPAFLNAAIRVETSLRPRELLAVTQAVEHLLGRRPARRWGPRPIDIDILFYGEETFDTPDLTIPHPRIAGRAFVLAPLSEIAPALLPGVPSAAALFNELDTSGITRTGHAL